ncbi:helix-turn-helix transcriptional regulator [Pontibacter sp. G13]|uniref:AraC family transcriptional regulator n=1 Tax=Pontibacter sp. G13 TaxID=3074898 RepID=UPI00288B9273|nr:helix-turn-helix transcriptional regulator [Pontibacter sp. G13]WNJ17045.1 helix-turn-helix transcriptional regulator [Pontibacter sp. G13]
MNGIPNISFKGNAQAFGIECLALSDLFGRFDELRDHNPKQLHRLNFFALLIVMEHTGVHQVDLQQYSIKQGSVLKIAKGQVHAFQGVLNYRGYLVIFTEEFVLRYFSRSSIDFISHLYNYHISTPLVEDVEFNESFIGQLTSELENPNDYAQENIVAKILELYLLRLERCSQHPARSVLGKEHYSQFFQFKNLVESHFQQTRNVTDYAESLSMSPKHLNAIVKEFTLSTAKAFIDQYVILEIKRTILSSDQSLKEIAYQMGFDEVTNFTKFFKKHTALTPKAFKASI